MNQNDVQAKLDVLYDNLNKLEILRSLPFDNFMSDFSKVDSALHRLQTSIEALIDISGFVVASLNLGSPATSANIIELLCEAGYIPGDKEKTYVKMVQFRNRIVHLYNHIDTRQLYEILDKELSDVKEFLANLIEIIEKHPD